MKQPAYQISNESITVVVEGRPRTIRTGAANFNVLRAALMAKDWKRALDALDVKKVVAAWAPGFKMENDQVFLDGVPLPRELNTRITAMVAGGEDPKPLCLFWKKLQNNPSKRSVDQLWAFLQHGGHPITKTGNFLAYKGVRSDFKDQHSGTFDNSPGNVHEMPRNQISDDPNEPCHEGFHVGALSYAQSFSNRVVICEVDPADVVCVPYDESHRKMRVSKYKVIGNHNDNLLSSTTHVEEKYDPEEFDIDEALLTKVPKKYAKMHEADSAGLLEFTMEQLREYAGKGLKIIGASKIPGGKFGLIDAIVRNRGE